MIENRVVVYENGKAISKTFEKEIDAKLFIKDKLAKNPKNYYSWNTMDMVLFDNRLEVLHG